VAASLTCKPDESGKMPLPTRGWRETRPKLGGSDAPINQSQPKRHDCLGSWLQVVTREKKGQLNFFVQGGVGKDENDLVCHHQRPKAFRVGNRKSCVAGGKGNGRNVVETMLSTSRTLSRSRELIPQRHE